MGIFGMFGKKKDKAEGGDYGGDMVDMMKMMAGMPDTMRKPMMKGRLSQLMSLPEERRHESIRNMIGSFHSLQISEGDRDKLITTRVEIVGEMPEEDRRNMMMSRTMALKDTPQLEEADQQLMKRVLPAVSESARAASDQSILALHEGRVKGLAPYEGASTAP